MEWSQAVCGTVTADISDHWLLLKHAYSNILRILSQKKIKLLDENSGRFWVWEGLRFVIVALPGLFSNFYFHISAQNIDCGYLLEPARQGATNEYPQPMFLRRN